MYQINAKTLHGLLHTANQIHRLLTKDAPHPDCVRDAAHKSLKMAAELANLIPVRQSSAPHQLTDLEGLGYAHDPDLSAMHHTLHACEHELAGYQLIYHLTGTLSQAIARHRDLHANAGLIVDLLTAEKRRLTTELNAAVAP